MNSRHSVERESSSVHSLREGVRKLLTEAASLQPHTDDEWIHSARKRMKRIRAALRLQRAALGDSLYRAANKEVRDSARPLTPVRDAAVLVESLKQLTRRIREQRYKAHADRARRLLLAELSSSRKRLTGDAMRRSAARLNKVNQRLSIASPKATDTESARLGMKNIYRKGRIACTDAKRRRSTEQLHEWRKQAKYLSNEATLMGKWFGRRLKKIRSRSQKLSTLLGEDHDLVLLKAKLQQLRASGLLIDGTAGDSFDRKIKRRREKLQSESFKLAKRLYRRSPDKFVAAIRRSFQNVDKG